MTQKESVDAASMHPIVHTPYRLTDLQWAFLVAVNELWPSEVWFQDNAYGQTVLIRSLAKKGLIYPSIITFLGGSCIHRQNVNGGEAVKWLKESCPEKFKEAVKTAKLRFW